jgi:hypothetical protein
MKNQPTYDDANLILKLYEMRREPRLREARKFIGGMPALKSREEFLQTCPPGSEENASFRMVTTYWEMAASFVVTGILNKELFFRANNLELVFVWEKVRGAIPEMRQVAKNPTQYRHLEEVAHEFIAWMNENAPEWYETWSANLRK